METKTRQQTLFPVSTIESSGVRAKPIIPARTAINWYYGNFLMSPSNALRNIDEEKYLDEVHKLVDSFYLEFEGQKMTHKQFLDIMKERGIHAKYYRYQKPKPTNCELCRMMGLRQW